MPNRKELTLQTDYSDLPLFGGLHPSENQYEAGPKTATKRKSAVTKEPVNRVSPSRKAVAKGTSDTKKASLKTPTPRPVPLASNSQAPQDALLISVSDMCKLLKVSRSTLIRMEKSGLIPGRITLGGSVRYHRQTVETWLLDLTDANMTKVD